MPQEINHVAVEDERARSENPPRPSWWEIAKRTGRQMGKDNVPLVSAGVAFYIFLSIIPGLAAVISVYSLVMGPGRVEHHFEYLGSILPEGTQQVEDQFMEIAADQAVAGWGAFLGLLFTLWTGSKATKALIAAIHLAYGSNERRGFVKLTALSLGLTLAGVVFAVLAIALVAVLPAILSMLGLGTSAQTLLVWMRWPLLIILFLTALAVLYRYAPNQAAVKWSWVTPGALMAVVLWVGGSILMSFYVSNFADYNKTYGSLGAIVLLLLWLYLTAFAIVAGAELNAASDKSRDENRRES